MEFVTIASCTKYKRKQIFWYFIAWDINYSSLIYTQFHDRTRLYTRNYPLSWLLFVKEKRKKSNYASPFIPRDKKNMKHVKSKVKQIYVINVIYYYIKQRSAWKSYGASCLWWRLIYFWLNIIINKLKQL